MSDTVAAARVAALRGHLAPRSDAGRVAAAVAAATTAAAASAAGTPPAGPPPAVDSAALQALLDHDNYATRARLKELMKDPLFVP
jgi:hypothetical protein